MLSRNVLLVFVYCFCFRSDKVVMHRPSLPGILDHRLLPQNDTVDATNIFYHARVYKHNFIALIRVPPNGSSPHGLSPVLDSFIRGQNSI